MKTNYMNIEELTRLVNILDTYRKSEIEYFENIMSSLGEICTFYDSSNNDAIENNNALIDKNFKLISSNHENEINYLNKKIADYVETQELTNTLFRKIGDSNE